MKKVGILAGEASGDLLGAKLIDALRISHPDVEFIGIGGTYMKAKGCQSLYDIERLSVMGLVEPLKRLPELWKIRRDLFRYFANAKPDLFIGIDAPDFNLGLEKKLRDAGIPTVHYVSPSVWAWRQYRIKKIAKAVDLILTLFPFENSFYEKNGVPVQYVGHPFASDIQLSIDKQAARRSLGIPEQGTYVALLPGSRRQELHFLSEPFILAAKQAYAKRPGLCFLTSHLNEERYIEFYDAHAQLAPEVPLTFFTCRAREVIAASDAVLVTSGTATLEVMLHKKPMVIAYRMPKLTYWLAKCLVKTKLIGLPNLLANEKIVPELIQDEVTPETLCQHLLDYLDHPERISCLEKKFTDLHQKMLVNTQEILANSISKVLSRDNNA